MSAFIPTDKAALRREFESKRNAVNGHVRAEADGRLFEHLFTSPAWERADTVLSYASVRGEIDLSPVWKQALSDGKRYALPRTITSAAEGQMVFQYVRTEEDLVLGRYHLTEPSVTCPEVSDWGRTLCIVPGLAFDKDGYRLGYGGGYYDRFLAAHPTVIPVGLCYDICFCDRLPRGDYDIPVSYIITERSVIACAR